MIAGTYFFHLSSSAIGMKQMFEQLSSTNIQMQDIQDKNYHYFLVVTQIIITKILYNYTGRSV